MSRFMFADFNLIDVSHTKNAHKFFNGKFQCAAPKKASLTVNSPEALERSFSRIAYKDTDRN